MYDVRFNANGTFKRFKARLVVKRYTEAYVIYYMKHVLL